MTGSGLSHPPVSGDFTEEEENLVIVVKDQACMSICQHLSNSPIRGQNVPLSTN